MRQQEANQFDKGLNLDTNPIAMSNHQLSGALNATMITMNGNELVLQNDMGNGKVDQAQLPTGYVPVGMKEYGGIVYVASYNPIKGESQIGCFPSPQRNIPSSDNGLQPNSLLELHGFINNEEYKLAEEFNLNKFKYYKIINNSYVEVNNPTLSEFNANLYYILQGDVKQIQDRQLLIDDIVRAGDKFIITSNDFSINDIINDLISLKVIVLDSEGNGIDITHQLKIYNQQDLTYSNFPYILKNTDNLDLNEYYNIYRNKISGKIYMQEELILPTYISAEIFANRKDDKVIITFEPNAFDEEGNVWTKNNIYNYDLRIINNNYTITKVPYVLTRDSSRVSGKNYYNENGQLINDDSILNSENFNSQENIYEKSDYSYEVDANDKIEYEIVPRYIYDKRLARITTLKRTGIIDVSLLQTGEVEFEGEFRYYNDWPKEQIMLDYSIQAYIDNSGYNIKNIYIQAYDIEDLFSNTSNSGSPNYIWNGFNDTSKEIKVQLNTSDYFGSYTSMKIYRANAEGGNRNNFDRGHYYIGRIVVETQSTVNPNISKTFNSSWYAIITSTITNDDYLNTNGNMYPVEKYSEVTPEINQNVLAHDYYIKNNNNQYELKQAGETYDSTKTYYILNNISKVFKLNWKTTFSREDSGTVQGRLSSIGNSRNIETVIPNTCDESGRIYYIGNKTGKLSYKYTGETQVITHESFPFSVSFNPDISLCTPKFSQQVNYDGELDQSGLVISQSDADINLGNADSANASGFAYSNQNINGTNKTQTIFYNIKSQFYSKYDIKNPNAHDNSKYLFSVDTEASALIPVLPIHYTDENRGVLRKVLGELHQQVPYNFAGIQISGGTDPTNATSKYIYPSRYFSYRIQLLDWDDEVGNWYSTWHDSEDEINQWISRSYKATYIMNAGGGTYCTVDEVTNSRTSVLTWENLCSKINNKLGETPMILMWYDWEGNDQSAIATSESTLSEELRYGIPMFRDASGNYYLINQFAYNNDNKGSILNELIKSFNTIYTLQTDQRIHIDYLRCSSDLERYKYTLPYNVTITSKVNITNNNPQALTLTNSNFNGYNKGNVQVSDFQFPIFELSNSIQEAQYTDVISAPDISVKVAEFLDNQGQPEISKCAIVKDWRGNTIITDAYTLSNGTLSSTSINDTHNYIFCGYTTDGGTTITDYNPNYPNQKPVLVDIDLTDPSSLDYTKNYALGKYGCEIAKAIKAGDLVRTLYDGYYIFTINSSKFNNRTIDTNYWLGKCHNSGNYHCAISVRRPIHSLVANHVLNLKLLNEAQGVYSIQITNFK